MRRAAFAAILLAACESTPPIDAGLVAAMDDAGSDAAMPDATMPDAAMPDAAIADTGPPAMACTASGVSCRPDEYCDRGVGRCRGPGRCMARPVECTEPVMEVCGCDGVTYGSACEASRAGASIEADGPC